MIRLDGILVRKFVKYAFFGGTGVALDFLVFRVLLHADFNYQLANAAGYGAGTVLSFVLNRILTFRVLDLPFRRFSMFVAVAAVGFSVSWVILLLLVEKLSIPPVSSKLLTIAAVVVIQFSLNSLVT